MTNAPERIHVRWGKSGDTRVTYMEERFMPPDNEAEYIRADLIAGALTDHNDLLRSAMQICERAIMHEEFRVLANWDAFYDRVSVTLKKHHAVTNEARAAAAATRKEE